jgi:hypothetical protein
MAGSPWTNQVVNLIILTEQTTGLSGLFGYSPTVGAGNLVVSVSANSGTDQNTNAYLAGISSYTGGGTSWSAISINGAEIVTYTATSHAGPWTQTGTIDYSSIEGALVLGYTEIISQASEFQLIASAPSAIPTPGEGITTVAEVVSALQSVGIFS